MQSDEELINEVLSGSHAAMEVLIKRHYKIIFSYIYRNIGDYHISYDLTQNVFIKVTKSLKNYKINEGKFQHWLIKIAVNCCNDYYRSSYYKNQSKYYELDESIEDETNVVDLLSHKQERQRVKEAILTLPEYQREAVILRFYHDMKIKEISELTQANDSTVKSRLKQGLSKLKFLLSRGDECERKKAAK